MRVVFVGSGEFAEPTLHFLSNEHEVAAVVTQPARQAGRGRSVRPTPVRRAAEEFGLPVIEAEDINTSENIERIRQLNAEIGVVVAFGQKLGPEVLESVPAGFVNLHASLLPAYRGAAPYQWAVIKGEERAGVTVFRLTARMDAGPILTQRWTYIKPEETASELHDRLSRIGPDAMRAALAMFEGGQDPEGEPQDVELVTRAPKLRKSDGNVDFARPADELADFVCGMWSWPGARCTFVPQDGSRQEDVILARARVGDPRAADLPPGTVDVRLFVATGRGWLELLEVKPSGGRKMTWPEFVNGRHVQAGDRFVTPEAP